MRGGSREGRGRRGRPLGRLEGGEETKGRRRKESVRII